MSGAPGSIVGQSSAWYKSSLSNGACACVETRFEGELVSIRDSKYRQDLTNDLLAEPTITVSTQVFSVWLQEVVGLAPAGGNGSILSGLNVDGTTSIRSLIDGTDLCFTPNEWLAFVGGARLGEFGSAPVLV